MKNSKLELIEKILIEYDLVKLIKMGAPTDEYHNEALMIYERVNRYNTIETMHQIIFDVFISQFKSKANEEIEQTIKIIGTFESYQEIAKNIKQIIGN